MSDSLQTHGLQPARLLCPWNSPGKNTGVGCYSLLQGGSSRNLLPSSEALPFPSPGDLPNPGMEPASLELQADSWPSEPGKIIRMGPILTQSTVSVFIREKHSIWRQGHIGWMLCDDRGRDWSDSSAGQGMPRMDGHHYSLGRRKEGFYQSIRGNIALMTS